MKKIPVRTVILDATCAPQKISFSQDVDLLNEARENLEGIVDDLCRRFDYYIPRMYRRNAQKDYLNLAKCKKRTSKKIRKAIRHQLQYALGWLSGLNLLVKKDFGLFCEVFVAIVLSPNQ